jgi:hypothetical protein
MQICDKITDLVSWHSENIEEYFQQFCGLNAKLDTK